VPGELFGKAIAAWPADQAGFLAGFLVVELA
jgi:hypothetical protein